MFTEKILQLYDGRVGSGSGSQYSDMLDPDQNIPICLCVNYWIIL